MAVHPMEGFDAELNGSPSELTFRRYKRYAKGGSGLIWFEATSVNSEGRSNPRQLILNAKNLDAYKRLVKKQGIGLIRNSGILMRFILCFN